MDEVEVVAVHSRQQPGAGPSGTGQGTLSSKQPGRQRRRAPSQRASEASVIDLTDDRDDDDVVITLTKSVKRPRLQPRPPSIPGTGPAGGPAATLAAFQMAAAAGPGAAALAAAAAAAASAAAAAPPAAPPSPKGYKCMICLDRMESDLATTTCGHMFCYKCISEWVKKSGNCPQCRSKLTKTKIIRVYPPAS